MGQKSRKWEESFFSRYNWMLDYSQQELTLEWSSLQHHRSED